MSESDESIIELIGIIRPMAANADGQKTIAGIFAQEKVAQETIKMMSVLGLIDEEALASALTKMVPEGTKQQAPAGPSHSNGPQGFPPASALPQTMAPLPGMGVGIPGQGLGGFVQPPPHGFDAPPGGGWNAPPPNMMPPIPPQQQQPPRGPGGGDISNLLGQGLSQEERTLVTAALSMSQQEVDMLPPQQRAIFMQLRSMMPGR